MTPRSILLIEDGTTGGGHARSNLSVLLAAHQAWPDAVLFLACTEEHHSAVKERMRFCGVVVPAYEYVQLDPGPEESGPHVARVIHSVSVWRNAFLKACKLLSITKSHKPDLVIDMWTNGLKILFLKLMKRFYSEFTTAFIHIEHNWVTGLKAGILRRLLFPHTLSIVKAGSNIGHAYGLLHGRMRHDILARTELPDFNNMFEFFYGITWPKLGTIGFPNNGEPLRFAYVSPSFKGLSEFARLTQLVRDGLGSRLWSRVEFRIVGKCPRERCETRDIAILETLGIQIPNGRLNEDEYAHAIAECHYAVHVFERAHYEIRYSSSLQDTLAFCRPAVMVRTSYVDSLRDLVASYGEVVESTEDAARAIIAIVESGSRARYEEDVMRAKELRECFSLKNSADQLMLGYELAQ